MRSVLGKRLRPGAGTAVAAGRSSLLNFFPALSGPTATIADPRLSDNGGDGDGSSGGNEPNRTRATHCPVCSTMLVALDDERMYEHVNACLDGTTVDDDQDEAQKETIDAEKEAFDVQGETIDAQAETLDAQTVTVSATRKFAAANDEELAANSPQEPNFTENYEPVKAEEDTADFEPSSKHENAAAISEGAFSTLMTNTVEDAAWRKAASTEKAKNIRAALRPCPFYKIMPDMPLAVDAFRYGKIDGIEAYFLSHFHSDHYCGLYKDWNHGMIYASKVTCALVKQQIGVASEWIVELPFNEPQMVCGIKVILLEANHCPGSALLYFKKLTKPTRRVLHCGDFRASPRQVLHPLIKDKYFDSIYLDTTYLNPKYAFPPQAEVIKAVAAACKSLAIEDLSTVAQDSFERARIGHSIKSFFQKDGETNKKQSRGRLLVVVGTYSIGKERFALGIAKALKSKIYANSSKRRIYSCLEDPELAACLTDDPFEAQVHMTALREIRCEVLRDYMKHFDGAFARCVAFRPTGWTFRSPTSRNHEYPSASMVVDKWKTEFDAKQLQDLLQRGSTEQVLCFGVPYSEHSSFRDLACFCMSMNYGRVIPTVNVHNSKSRERMKALITKWDLEKQKNGKMQFEFADESWNRVCE